MFIIWDISSNCKMLTVKENSLNIQQEAKSSHTLSVASWWELFLSSPTHLSLKHSDVQKVLL